MEANSQHVAESDFATDLVNLQVQSRVLVHEEGLCCQQLER